MAAPAAEPATASASPSSVPEHVDTSDGDGGHLEGDEQGLEQLLVGEAPSGTSRG